MSPKCLLVLLLAVVVLTSPSLGDYMKPHPHEHMAPTPMGLPPKGEMPPTHGHHPAHPPMEHGEDLHKPPRKVMPPAPTPSEKPHGWGHGHGHGHGPPQPIHKLAPSPHSI